MSEEKLVPLTEDWWLIPLTCGGVVVHACKLSGGLDHIKECVYKNPKGAYTMGSTIGIFYFRNTGKMVCFSCESPLPKEVEVVCELVGQSKWLQKHANK